MAIKDIIKHYRFKWLINDTLSVLLIFGIPLGFMWIGMGYGY